MGLVIAIALIAAATAFIASTTRQNKEAEIRRMSASASSTKLLKNSAVAFFLTDDGTGSINGRLPCPDTNFPPDGTANGTTTCTATTGVVPWLTLGLSQDDTVDAYGNYFTYVVPADEDARNICDSITNAYDSTQTEYTGTLNAVTDTEVRLSSQTAGQGDAFYYAFISHGKNGLGAISQSGAARQAPTSASEIQNCPSNNANCTDATPLAIISGPKSTDPDELFDDVVYLASRAQLTKLCETQTPAQKVNAFVNEDFTGATIGALPSSLASVNPGAAVQQSTVTAGTTNPDLVLRFTGTSAAVAAATQVPSAERPTYISFEWKPTAVASNQAGMSIGFRATITDLESSNLNREDIFNINSLDGLTLRFYEDANNNANGSVANPIYLCDDVEQGCSAANNLASSGADTFTIAQNEVFLIEAYDDGTYIWARITEIADPTNTATLSFVAVDPALPYVQQDLDGDNSVLLINHVTATTEVDDILITRGAMGVAFDGTDDIVETSGGTLDSHDTTTGNLTLEAWVYPDTLVTGSSRSTLVSKWTDAGSNSGQAYRLYLTNSGTIAADLAGDDAAVGTNIITSTASFGYRLSALEWTYVAVTFDATAQLASLYVDGELAGSTPITTFASSGINNGTSAFSIGSERNNASAIVNEFDGNITDVRVWNTVRTADEIFANYRRRLSLTSGGAAGLIVNWTLDRDTDRLFTSTTATATAASTAGAVGNLAGNAAFVGAFQQFLPIFSRDICPAGTVVTPYQCDFRTTAQSDEISIPNNFAFITVKAWGGGGGGYDFSTNDASGGGGGFSTAQLRAINSVPISGLNLRIDGGGGGASSGDDNNQGAGSTPNCNTAGNCGPGGGGGGPANITTVTGLTTTRAPDQNQNVCGGRGGDNTTFGADPPNTTDGSCESGGDDPTGTAGASGAGTATGGVSLAGAGGAGYNGTDDGAGGAADSIGGGGGGGGARLSDMTAGGGEAGAFDSLTIDTDTNNPDDNGSGFGGGGGAGFADSAGTLVPYGAAAGTAPATTGTTDPDYAPSYCDGSTCITNPGRGGEPASTAGKQGVVVLKW